MKPKKIKNMILTEWNTKFSEGEISESAAELAAKFMFAMSYYHERMKLHIMLHPLFFLAGLLSLTLLGM